MRDRMVTENLAQSTIAGYSYGVKQLALFTKQAFTSLKCEDIYAFFVHLKEDRKLSCDTMRISACGIKYLYKHILKVEDMVNSIPYPKRGKYLPEILTSDELRKLFDLTTNIKHRAFLKLVYSSGLRREEACKLLITDIDNKNMQVHVRQGKGKKDRYTILAHHALDELQEYIHQEQPQHFLFNGRKKGQRISNNSTRWIMDQAVDRTKITKKVSLHSLRHSFASHLVSMGENIIIIQKLLGHEDIRHTMLYMHVGQLNQKPVKSPLDLIYPEAK